MYMFTHYGRLMGRDQWKSDTTLRDLSFLVKKKGLHHRPYSSQWVTVEGSKHIKISTISFKSHSQTHPQTALS